MLIKAPPPGLCPRSQSVLKNVHRLRTHIRDFKVCLYKCHIDIHEIKIWRKCLYFCTLPPSNFIFRAVCLLKAAILFEDFQNALWNFCHQFCLKDFYKIQYSVIDN